MFITEYSVCLYQYTLIKNKEKIMTLSNFNHGNTPKPLFNDEQFHKITALHQNFD